MTKSELEQSALTIARAILDGSIPTLLACREMARIFRQLKLRPDDALRLFVGIDSETDHLPLEPLERQLWEPSALAKKDEEIERYTKWAHSLNIRTACESVILRFTTPTNDK